MDVITIGVFKNEDVFLLEEIAKKNSLLIVWDFEQFNIEAETGIKDLKKYFNLHKTGILINGNFAPGDIFYSYPLIIEVSDYYMATEWEHKTIDIPKLFGFFNSLNCSILRKLIIAFSDEWNENSTVKIEEINFADLKGRLNSFFVWCCGFKNLRTNIEVRDESHPLVLTVTK